MFTVALIAYSFYYISASKRTIGEQFVFGCLAIGTAASYL